MREGGFGSRLDPVLKEIGQSFLPGAQSDADGRSVSIM